MAETLLLEERVRNTIKLGESHFREFKSALNGVEHMKVPRGVKEICRDIAEALVAFSNADGGELLIGVEDNGEISGIPHSDKEIVKMIEAPKTHVHPDTCLSLTHSDKLKLDGKCILFFSVIKASEEVCQLSDGRCLKRRDKQTIPETPRNIHFERQEIKSREYDRLFADGATVSDLDLNLLKALAEDYLKGLSIERYLQQIGVAEYSSSGLRLRNAAMLLFAGNITKWHPRCQVRILKIQGSELLSGERYNVTSDEQVQGNIFELMFTAWEKLRPYLANKTEFGADGRFVQKYIYPEDACREALVNALAHRDYTISNGIDVFVFNDRMTIKSPGPLLSTISLEDLETLTGVHESRNSFIARVLRENKFMRELGEGLRRIYGLMEESDLEKPRLETSSASFSITLPHKSVFTEKQLEYLKFFDNYQLTRMQKRIVSLGVNDKEISPEDIYIAMNTDNRDVYDREVTFLRGMKILEEIRSNVEANRISKKDRITKRKIGRFRIKVPNAHEREKCKLENLAKGVFVANLPFDVSVAELKKIFSSYGNVESVQLPASKKGFGFIYYDNEDSAKKAIRALDRFNLRGREIKTDKLRPSPIQIKS